MALSQLKQGLQSLRDVRKVSTDSFLATPEQMRPSQAAGPIEQAYFAHDGLRIHKWHHYLPLYDRYFAPYRNSARAPLRMLEIGVNHGGSLELWRGYFGPDAIIYGVDINPKCAALDTKDGTRVRIGSQADPAFLKSVVAEMGGVDIVLDDGSHIAEHMNISFDILFPLLSEGGLYVVEDLACAYWTKFGGGYRKPTTFIERAKTLNDDIHHWWHRHGVKVASAKGMVSGIHVHDSVIVIEKNKVETPVNSRIGVTTI